MAYQVVMVLGVIASFVIPIACGATDGAMIAAHLCILVVALAIFLGTLNLNKSGRPK